MTPTQTSLLSLSHLPFGRRTQPNPNWSRVRTAVSSLIAERRNSAMRNHATALEERLHRTVAESWPRRHHSRYNSVKVLLTYWAETDDPSFKADEAAKKLADVFQRLYGFEVEIWLIPSIDQPQQFFKQKLAKCVQSRGKKENLLILWYGGLAEISEDEEGPLFWYGEKWGGRINSGIVPQILGAGKADVLTLYDCGNSLHGQSVFGGGIFEHLGASSNQTVTGFGHAGSFTRSLVQVLDRPESAAYGISVLDIHRKLVNRARRHRNSAVLEDVSSVYSNDNMATRSWLTDCAAAWPVYCHLSACSSPSKSKPSSIVISHLEYPLEVVPCDDCGQGLEVQIKLVLSTSELNMQRWKDWILSAPSEIKNVIFQVTEN